MFKFAENEDPVLFLRRHADMKNPSLIASNLSCLRSWNSNNVNLKTSVAFKICISVPSSGLLSQQFLTQRLDAKNERIKEPPGSCTNQLQSNKMEEEEEEEEWTDPTAHNPGSDKDAETKSEGGDATTCQQAAITARAARRKFQINTD